MRRYDGVNSSAWQSCAAALALISRDPSFKDFSFNELQTLFRWCCRLFLAGQLTFAYSSRVTRRVIRLGIYASCRDSCQCSLQTLTLNVWGRLSKLVSVRSVDYLRVAGSAFLVTGTVHYTGLDMSLSKVYEGACMLPATPALYWCTTDVKVRHICALNRQSRHASVLWL